MSEEMDNLVAKTYAKYDENPIVPKDVRKLADDAIGFHHSVTFFLSIIEAVNVAYKRGYEEGMKHEIGCKE